MKNDEGETLPGRRNLFLATAVVVALVVPFVAGVLTAPLLQAQSTAGQATTAQPPTPQWQVVAGGKMAFDVVSVKQDTADPSLSTVSSNFPLGPGAVYAPNGGLLSARNFPLFAYIAFAYKVTSYQMQSLRATLPKWVITDRFDIQARAEGNPSKDQMRLMMQSLLADRFKMTMHRETRQLPVFALVLDKPGKLGPKLQPHSADADCTTGPTPPLAPGSEPPPTASLACGGIFGMPSNATGHLHIGARNVTIGLLADSLTGFANDIDRQVLDRTGLTGAFDFTLEWTPQLNGPLPPGVNFQPDPNGPTFQEALKEQLGLKLESQTGPVDVIVIDHVEPPSEN